MKALIESTSGISFTSDEDKMKSPFRLINQDVFGAAVNDLDIWFTTPVKSQGPKYSMKEEQKIKSSCSKHTTEDFDQRKSTSKSTKPNGERRNSKAKRSSTSGRRKERTTTAAEELAPALAPRVGSDKSKRSSTNGIRKSRKEQTIDPAAEELAPELAPPLVGADKSKRSSTSGIRKSRKDQTTYPAAEELAPVLAPPLVGADKSKRRSSTSGSTKSRKERTAEELAPALAPPLVSADKSKRRSTSGSTKSRKERTTDPAAEEVAPALAPPLVSADKSKRSSTSGSTKSRTTRTRTFQPKQPLHQDRNEPLPSEDSLDVLMQRLKNERAAQPQDPRKHKTAESGISVEPKRFTAAAIRGEASRNKKKSYLPRSQSRFSKARRESVSDSLNKFLADNACIDLPPKSALRSVYSSPGEDSKRKKVRPSRRTRIGGESSSERKPKTESGFLEKHLQSTRPRNRQGGAQRSVASAPADASLKNDLLTKCQALKLAF
jgi:hypothetical protein